MCSTNYKVMIMMTLNKNLIITQHIYTNLLTACVDFVLTARRCRPVYLHFLPIYAKENNSDYFFKYWYHNGPMLKHIIS